MYRQLYNKAGIASLDAGAPSIKYTGDIRPQMTMSQPDPMDALNDLAMQLFGKPLDMLTPSERDALDEYNSGMMATGGRANYSSGNFVTRKNYGIGSWFQENIMDKVVKPVLDPVAQLAAVIPNPYQPYAQAYTGIRAATASPDGYGGLQVGGFTPGAYGGKYGVNPFSSGNLFKTQGIIPTFDSIDPSTGISVVKSVEVPSSITNKSLTERIGDIVSNVIGKGRSGDKEEQNKSKTFLEKYAGIISLAAAGTLGALAYKDQKKLSDQMEKDFAAYKEGVASAKERFKDPSSLASIKVSGPRTAADVVRAPVMDGGIMNTRMGYGSGSEDLEYKGWKKIFLKSNDAAESHPRHSEFIKRFAEETMGQDRSPEVRIKKAIGGDLSEPISSFEQNTMMAGPDWYVKRVEILMELGYDYETASEIAFDSNLYDDAVGGMNKGGRPGYALGDTATMAAQTEGLPLRNNQAGITELDLRDSGGFIPPVGIKEKADDIPAMLSNNEFVFTADAVRGMGDGDVDVGAQRMYDIMKKLEKGGRV